MDDKHYEEIIAADPSADLDELGLSADERADAERFRDEMRALDESIARALAIDVPDLAMPELPDIGGDNVTHMPTSNKPRLTPPAWIALAASVALVAVFGARFLGSGDSYPSLAAELIAHLDHEPGALVVTSTPVEERRLQRVVNRDGVQLDNGVGLVTYARSCEINGKSVPHLVIQGQRGPVTLLLMPDEFVEEAQVLQGENINGVILPVGDGSIAIIGERGEDLGRIQEQVVDSVTWSI
jgi:hypothetical protein